MEAFNIKLAGHVFGIETRYTENLSFFSDYLTDSAESPVITASVPDDALERITEGQPDIPPRYAELTALYRPIAETLPLFCGTVFHGAAISYGGKGYIFTAPSGTGKSTHIRLWHKHLGNSVDIINGDKPVITADADGIFVHGTPWAGKEMWHKNRSVPLGGICILHRGDSCKAEGINANEALPFILRQTYRPEDPDSLGKTMDVLDSVLRHIPVISLYCDMSEDAVRCSFEALCGKSFDENKIG